MGPGRASQARMDSRAFATGNALGSRDLAILLAVAGEGSLRRGAAELGISPAAVSKAVRLIEGRLGAPVFERGPGGVVPTPAGRRLLEQGREGLVLLAQAEQQFRSSGNSLSGLVRIGSGPIPAADLARRVIPEAKRRWPDMRLSVELGAAQDLVTALAQRRLDCAVCHAEDIDLPRGVRAQRLQRLEAAVLVRTGHPLAGAGTLAPSALAGYALAGFQPYGRFRQWFRDAVGEAPDFALVASDYDMLADATARSDMLLFTSRHQAEELVRRHQLVQLALAGEPFRHDVFLIAPDRQASAESLAVIGLIGTLLTDASL